MSIGFQSSTCQDFKQSACQNRNLESTPFVPMARGIYSGIPGGCSSQADVDAILAVFRTEITSVPDNAIRWLLWPSLTHNGDFPYDAPSWFDGSDHDLFFNSSGNCVTPDFGRSVPLCGWTNGHAADGLFLYTQIKSRASVIRKNWIPFDNGTQVEPDLGIGGANPYHFNTIVVPGFSRYATVNGGTSPTYGPFDLVQSWPKNTSYLEIPMPAFVAFAPENGSVVCAGVMNYLASS